MCDDAPSEIQYHLPGVAGNLLYENDVIFINSRRVLDEPNLGTVCNLQPCWGRQASAAVERRYPAVTRDYPQLQACEALKAYSRIHMHIDSQRLEDPVRHSLKTSEIAFFRSENMMGILVQRDSGVCSPTTFSHCNWHSSNDSKSPRGRPGLTGMLYGHSVTIHDR